MGGGDPTTIHDGGAKLTSLSREVSSRKSGFTQAGSGIDSGSAEIDAALARFAAAGGAYSEVMGDQLEAAGKLATNASADLSTATGGK